MPDEIIVAFHRELNKQTATFNETVKPLELKYYNAIDALDDAEAELLGTVPTTSAGIAAVLQCIFDSAILRDSVACQPMDLLHSLAEAARRLPDHLTA